MRVADIAIRVTPDQETQWSKLAAEAIAEVTDGKRKVPTVRFRTDTGVVGSIPVAERFTITFANENEPAGFLGTLTQFG